MFAVLRHRPFRNLWLGQAISQLGDAFYFIVFMFMTQQVTGSAVDVGIVGAAETIPFLIFGPQAGVAADRFDRRRTMLLSDLGSALVLLTFSGVLASGVKPPLAALVLTTFTLSTMRVFFMPAKTAAIPALVPDPDVMPANALSSATMNTMQLFGLSVSGSLVAVLYARSPGGFYATAMGLNALSFLGSAVFIFLLPRLVPEPRPEAHVWADIKEGLAYVRSRHELKVMIALLAIFRLSVAPFFVFYLAANKTWFGNRPEYLVWMEFSFFVGMLIGSALMARVRAERPGLWFSWGLAVVGFAVAAMAFSPIFLLMAGWNVVAGLAVPAADLPINTYLQTSVPDAFRGRVAAVQNGIATGVMPIGMFLGGLLAERLGITGGFLAMGIGMVAACLVGLLDRRFRQVRMPASAL